MGRVFACLFVISCALTAQTAETAYFRAVMLPANEVPATTIDATAVADLIAHVVRDSSGQIVSGTVDFLIRAKFASDVTATGLHIHTGAAGANGGVVIGTSLSGTASLPVKGGGDVVRLPAQVLETSTSAVAALRGMFQDASKYYVNIHTTDFPNGAMRGQLQPAVGTVLMGVMSSANENPPVLNASSGMATVVALASFDASGALTTAETYQSTTYNTEDRGTFTGFHIHTGTVGNNGAVVINSAIPSGTAISASGTGTVGPFYTEIDLKNATQVAVFNNLFVNPAATYINIHTNQHTGGVMRAQLRPTDTMAFPVVMSSTNESPTPSVAATAPAVVTLHTLRNEDGSIAAGSVFFDVDYRLPGAANFTGLHIHDGAAGSNAPVSIGMVPTYDAAFSSATGFGNYYNWTQAVLNLAILEDITKNPENHYVNIHTSADGSGVARAQLAPGISTPAVVAATIAANLDKNATTVAPGGLISIFGTNLAKVAVGLDGWQGRTLPGALNGASVTIGGKRAPLLYVSRTQINAQVPVDVPVGPQSVVVDNGAGPSASSTVTVAAAAPAIFFFPVAAILKSTDFTLVSDSNPAHTGDVVLVYATGLGLTSPAITTGGLVQPGQSPATSTVTATVGGKDAQVVSSVAALGGAGLYQVAIAVPAGVTGSVAVVLQQGTTKSNSVNLAVR